MEYVCLAAGKGTRFGLLGRYLQKCMYPVGLTPFVACTVKNLIRSRAVNPSRDRLTFVVGHHAEQVQRYFGPCFEGLTVHYVEQREQLGTGHALHLAYQTLQPTQPVVAWLADLYVPTALFDRVNTHPDANVQTLGPGSAEEKADLQVSVAGERVVKAWQGEGDYDIGLWKLSPAVLARMTRERHGEYRMMPNLQAALADGHRVGYVRTDEWLHLGGTLPSPEKNVLAVAARVLELEQKR